MKRIDDAEGAEALRLASLAQGPEGIDRETLATAVRYALQLLADRAPGHTVEVRVPPFGAVQAVEGPRHTSGTPPNVIETDPATWIALAIGAIAFSDAIGAGRALASGSRADLTAYLPLTTATMDA